jgi:SAM-dependent methyltransferase
MRRKEETDRKGYAAIAGVYHRTRPSYPGKLLDILLRHTGLHAGDPVAEIGAGTGHFTRLLAGRGLAVVAVEPVAEMRAQAHSLKGVTWMDGTFGRTGLPDGSQRWVVSAQAFHQTQASVALPEIRRILQPGGWFTALWNAHHIAREPVLVYTYSLLRRYIPGYQYTDRTTWHRRWSSRLVAALPEAAQLRLGTVASFSGIQARAGRGLQLLSTGDFGPLAYHEIEHLVRVSRDAYLDRWQSRSELRSMAGPQAFEAFVSELTEYLDRGRIEDITVPYVCGAWSARVRCG